MDPNITNGCDSGQPIVVSHPDSSQVIHIVNKLNFKKNNNLIFFLG